MYTETKVTDQRFRKVRNQGHDVIGTRIFPDTVGAERGRASLFVPVISAAWNRESNRSNPKELSLHMVRSSSVLKYSSA